MLEMVGSAGLGTVWGWALVLLWRSTVPRSFGVVAGSKEGRAGVLLSALGTAALLAQAGWIAGGRGAVLVLASTVAGALAHLVFRRVLRARHTISPPPVT